MHTDCFGAVPCFDLSCNLFLSQCQFYLYSALIQGLKVGDLTSVGQIFDPFSSVSLISVFEDTSVLSKLEYI